MSVRFVHHLHDCVEGWHDGVRLFRYIYHDHAARELSPKPHFNELRTIADHVVTTPRPHDHRWHQGLAMTCAHLNGDNFWGGPTYVRGRDYVMLDNHGSIEHRGWSEMPLSERQHRWIERLAWISRAGETWIDETRTIEPDASGAGENWWRLRLGFDLKNVHREPLRFGSPGTEGRSNAGYGGLFWRGPRDFTGGMAMSPNGNDAEKIRGTTSPWLAYVGAHDGTDSQSTLIFRDDSTNPRFPNKWFVRSNIFACVSICPMFDEYLVLEPGGHVSLRYEVIIADGAWPRARVEAFVAS